MGKIKTITPVHISNGESIKAIKAKEYMYSFDYLTNQYVMNISLDRIKDVSKKIFKSDNLSNEEYAKILNVDLDTLTKDEAINPSPAYGKYVDGAKKIYGAANIMGKPYIPGSTLKGLIFNVFWFHLIQSNQEIANYLKNNRNIRKDISNLDNSGKSLRRFFIVRDVVVPSEMILYEVNRYSSKKEGKANNPQPCGNVETIDKDILIKDEIVKELTDDEKEMLKESKNKLLKECDSDNIKRQYVEALYDFILHFKDVFQEWNYKYMKFVIEKEQDFMKRIINPNVDKNEILNFYQNILERLEKKEIIVQVGKFTNYFDKSFCCSFGEFYNNYFEKLFTPNKKKKQPTIDSINLITIDHRGISPLGFVSLEF